MEITINKKTIISFAICVVMCISCFLAGRFIRFKRVSGTGKQLVEGIVLTRSEVDTIADEVGVARNSIQSGADLGRAVINGIKVLREGSEFGELCINEIKRSIEDDQRFNSDIQQTYTDYFESTAYALDLAIERAKLYERIISAYQQADGNNSENSRKSE